MELKLEDRVFDKRSFLKGALGMALGVVTVFPQEAKADDLNDALFAMGALLESGIVPTKDYRDADFLRRLGIAQQKIALYNSIHVRCQPQNLDIVPFEMNPLLRPAASFYVYNGWRDFDGNKSQNRRVFGFVDNTKIKEELVGVNKKSFYQNESLWVTLITKNLKGHSATLLFLDPQKNEVFSDRLRIDDYALFKNWNIGKDNWKNNVLGKHGYGNYYAAFYIDDQLIGVRGFNWMSNHVAYIGNYWADLDNNDAVNISEEIIGLNKKVFGRDEKITVVLSSHESIGTRVDAKLLAPSGDKIDLYSTRIKYKHNVSRSEALNARDLVERYGSGSYKAAFYIDSSYGGSIDFEIR